MQITIYKKPIHSTTFYTKKKRNNIKHHSNSINQYRISDLIYIGYIIIILYLYVTICVIINLYKPTNRQIYKKYIDNSIGFDAV